MAKRRPRPLRMIVVSLALVLLAVVTVIDQDGLAVILDRLL